MAAASPRKSRAARKTNAAGMEGAPTPTEFVKVTTLCVFEAVAQAEVKKCKGTQFSNRITTVKKMVKGGKYYFPHELTFSQEGEQETKEVWLFHAECIHSAGDIRRVHYADGHDFAGVEADTTPWEDLDATAEAKAEVYAIWEPEMEEASRAVLGGSVKEFLASHDTIKRSPKPKRSVMLEKVITKLIEDGAELKDQSVADVMAKTMEELAETGQPAPTLFGQQTKNIEIVQSYFKREKGEEEEKGEDEGEDRLMGKLREVEKEMMKGLGEIRDELKVMTGKINLKGVQEKVGKGGEKIGEEKGGVIPGDDDKDKEEGVLVDTQPDGNCLYHFLSGIEDLRKKKTDVENLEYTQEKGEEAKAQILHNSVSYYESLIMGAEGDDRAKEKVAADKFCEVAGEEPHIFLDRLTAGGVGRGGAGRQGGHVESSIWSCNSSVRILTVDGDHIYKGVDKSEAMAKHILRTMWPGENEKTEMVIAVRIKGHFWWGAVNKKGQKKAIFSIEEAPDALGLVVDLLLKRQPPVSLGGLARMTKDRRAAAILEQATQKKKKNKKKKKNGQQQVSWGGQQQQQQQKVSRGGAQQQQQQNVSRGGAQHQHVWRGGQGKGGKEDGWKMVGRGGRLVDERKGMMTVTVTKPSPVSTLVVWTSLTADQLEAKMKAEHPAAAKLVKKARSMKDHIILMAQPDEANLLRSMQKGLYKQGLPVQVYRHKEARLAHAARAGVDQQVRGAGVCQNFYQNQPCKWGINCRFRCYNGGGGWGI